MSAKYLFRLDDACSTYDRSKWERVERIFDKHKVRPIVAVVPDNLDEQLVFDQDHSDFWETVKNWENKGWSVAMHGFQHFFHKVNKNRMIFPYYDRSEFAGLSLDEQRLKIRKSLRVFENNGISPTLWVAPAHCFDNTTLDALSIETDFKIISDGIALRPYSYRDFKFIPQQLWGIRKRYFGLWTVCLHPNNMSLAELDSLEEMLDSDHMKTNVVGIDDIKLTNKKIDLVSYIYSKYFWIKRALKSYAKNVLLSKRRDHGKTS